MQRSDRELWLALLAIVIITLTYAMMLAATQRVPAASSFYGHTIGILGFILMLMTETLYSLRKRSPQARWGRMSDWLSFHIFTGIVGPYMVLLHTSWKFHGLAGVTLLLTVIIVTSGFIGRYIYTAVPRAVDGVELEAAQVDRYILQIEYQLQNQASKMHKTQLQKMKKRQALLQRQVKSLAKTRRMLALWHVVHIPIGVALFTVAFLHILGAVYYATLLR